MTRKRQTTKGYVKLPRSVLFDLELTDSDRIVYAVVRSHRKEKGNGPVYPSRERIAFLLDCSLSTVKRSIINLRKHGHLDWISGGSGRANTYEFFVRDNSDHGSITDPMSGSGVNPLRATGEPEMGSGVNHQLEPLNKNNEISDISEDVYPANQRALSILRGSLEAKGIVKPKSN